MTFTSPISEAKKQLGRIGSQLKSGSKVSILKNGKPFIYIIPSHDIESYESFLEQRKREKEKNGMHP